MEKEIDIKFLQNLKEKIKEYHPQNSIILKSYKMSLEDLCEIDHRAEFANSPSSKKNHTQNLSNKLFLSEINSTDKPSNNNIIMKFT